MSDSTDRVIDELAAALRRVVDLHSGPPDTSGSFRYCSGCGDLMDEVGRCSTLRRIVNAPPEPWAADHPDYREVPDNDGDFPDGCDCREACSMGTSCPGWILARLSEPTP